MNAELQSQTDQLLKALGQLHQDALVLMLIGGGIVALLVLLIIVGLHRR
jgi:hypothetical protein